MRKYFQSRPHNVLLIAAACLLLAPFVLLDGPFGDAPNAPLATNITLNDQDLPEKATQAHSDAHHSANSGGERRSSTQPSADTTGGTNANQQQGDLGTPTQVDPKPTTGTPTTLLTPEELGFFPDTEIGRNIKAAMIAANGYGPNAEAEYQAALAVMRANPKEHLTMLSQGYDMLDEIDYIPRMGMTAMMGELNTHEAASKLSEIALAPMPPFDPTNDRHGPTPAMQEGLVRFTAIDGLQELAKSGNGEADQALLALMTGKDDVLRKRATLAYVESSPDREARQREAAAALPEEDRWMVHRATVSARQMPVQAPPEGHVERKRLERGEPAKTGDKRQIPKAVEEYQSQSKGSQAASEPDEG